MSEQATHTPGPWEWFGDQLDGGEHGGECVLLLTDDGREYGMHSPVLQMDNEVADRALIAAAPDLLEACQAIHCMVDDYCAVMNEASEYTQKAMGPLVADLHNITWPAITKATGGTA